MRYNSIINIKFFLLEKKKIIYNSIIYVLSQKIKKKYDIYKYRVLKYQYL